LCSCSCAAPLSPPPILGLGTGGGFTYILEDLQGGDPKALAPTVRGLTIAANQNPQLAMLILLRSRVVMAPKPMINARR
jgi:hypothetical protein